jgi:hypothetical protein
MKLSQMRRFEPVVVDGRIIFEKGRRGDIYRVRKVMNGYCKNFNKDPNNE